MDLRIRIALWSVMHLPPRLAICLAWVLRAYHEEEVTPMGHTGRR